MTTPPKLHVSDIIKHCLETKNPYPLQHPFKVVDDLTGEGLIFDEDNWCSVSKSDFARWVEVTGNQVSR